jgi:hypothetical protein
MSSLTIAPQHFVSQPPLRPVPRSAPVAAAPPFPVAALREVATAPSPEDGLWLPIASDHADAVYAEPRDGGRLVFEDCTAIDVRAAGAPSATASVRRIRGRVMVSDARITFACSRYERAARPRLVRARSRGARGRMLVGQVRYPWIQAVHAENRRGHGGPRLQLLVAGSGGETLQVQVSFRKRVDALALAAEIIRRTSRFRLRTDTAPLSVDDHARFQYLASLPPLVSAPAGQLAGETFPSAWPASEHSARFGM